VPESLTFSVQETVHELSNRLDEQRNGDQDYEDEYQRKMDDFHVRSFHLFCLSVLMTRLF
jgi:hypothetical protein